VLVRVYATGVIANELKWDATYQTKAGSPRALPIPGHDLAGVVMAIPYSYLFSGMTIRPVSSFLTIGYNIAVRVLYKPFERRQKKRFASARLISAMGYRCAPQAA
jgi:hypothetical protein